jgi:hypothetical protein
LMGENFMKEENPALALASFINGLKWIRFTDIRFSDISFTIIMLRMILSMLILLDHRE